MVDQLGVPLAHYLDAHPGTDIRLNCEACARSRTLPMEGVVRRLQARGMDPRATGVRSIAKLVEAACVCGRKAWSTWPEFPPVKMGMRD